ncbi:hypothetical protein KQI84_18360 [bacterium]|nr:hypothetical protein [bacterium]
MTLFRLVSSAFLALALAASAQAESINVNFTGNGGATVSGTAGVIPAANWNNVGGTTGTQSGLLDSAGATTGAAVDWQAQASWFSGHGDPSENGKLLDGYLAVQTDAYDYDVTVTGIPYSSYDVYAYFGNNSAGADGVVRINGSGTQFFYQTVGASFPGFVEVTERTSDSPQTGNFVLFENVVGATLTIQQANYNLGQDSGLMGFQVVDSGAPDPTLTVDASSFLTNETLNVHFAYGPGGADNNVVAVPHGSAASATPNFRYYVGGGTSPSTGEVSGTLPLANAGGLGLGWYDLYFLSDAAGSSILAGPVTIFVSPPDPVVVSVGPAGSYASTVPSHEGSGPMEMLYEREIYVTPDRLGDPIPTNDWWTDLIGSQYAGQMWAYPLVVSADAGGVNVYSPRTWDGGGAWMNVDSPIQIHGEVVPDPDPSFVLIADFEDATYPIDWTTTGTAFGSGPATGALAGQSAVSGWTGNGFVNSFNGGDVSMGALISPDFTIQSDYIHFQIGGGNHPDLAAVQLVVGGSVVRSSTGADSENLTWDYWDVSALAGQTAHIEIIDFVSGGWGHILADTIFQSDDLNAPTSTGTTFTAADARAADWGDWTVTARVAQTETKYIDVTFGHGLPYTWLEFEDVDPILVVDNATTFFDLGGSTVSMPTTTDYVGIDFNGKPWGLFLPDNTMIDYSGTEITLTFAGAETWAVLAALPVAADLAAFYATAFAKPVDSVYSWTYDPTQGTVTTNWELMTSPLKGSGTDLIQGWIPHHYRVTTRDFAFNGLEYDTPRGRMQCATGRQFEIVYPFNGILPHIPQPQISGLANDYLASRMNNYISDYAGVTNYGAETYFGGKDMLRFARYLSMAHSTGHAAESTLEATLRGALEDWLTYTPGETEHYYAYYPNWKALVGFNESFGSSAFTDHHFHYGYLTHSAAILGLLDPSFLTDYGEMASLVAKEYANWDRADTRFPFLRTYDIWAGHSYAGGLSGPTGNNQESSSEAINSWVGVFLLGEAMGDADMAAAGAMGFAIESRAVQEYWLDMYGTNWPAAYDKSVVGILFDGGNAFATYFSGDPAWIHGIQWIPSSPTFLAYLVEDPTYAAQHYTDMMAERVDFGESATIAGMGSSLGNLVLGYLLMFDADQAAAELDSLYAANDPVATDVFTGGRSYYYTHSMRTLGAYQFDYHMSLPMGAVFHNDTTATTTYLAWNPTGTTQQVEVFQSGSSVGCFTAGPGELTAVTSLDPTCTGAQVGEWRVLND